MKQRAKELDLQKRTQRAGGSKSFGSSTGMGSNMYSSSSSDNKPDTTPTPVTYQTSTSSYAALIYIRHRRTVSLFYVHRSALRPSATGKAMKLGTKGPNVESFVDKLKSEGETVANTVPVISGAGGSTSKSKTQSISLSEAEKGE